MTPAPATPAYCEPPRICSAFSQPLPHAALAACVFDRKRWRDEDFAIAQVDAPQTVRRAVAKRQAEFLAGRLCARHALHALGIADAAVPTIGADGAPLWPSGIRGSITHGSMHALALAGDARHWRGIGIDLEAMLPDAEAALLAPEILTAAERARHAPLDGRKLTLCFSLKESLFKALYPLVEQRFYFEAAEVLDWDADGHARLRLLHDLSNEWRAGTELAAHHSLFEDQLLSRVAIPA